MPRSFSRHTNAPPNYQGLAYRVKAEHINELQIALEEDDARIDQKADTSAVQGMVETSLSQQPTVVNAAEDAVTDEIARRNIVEGTPINDADVGFSFTDITGQRSWLEGTNEGEPTEHAAKLIAKAAEPHLTKVPKETPAEATGVAFGITDNIGQRSDFEFDLEGHITQRVIDLWSARIAPVSPYAAYELEITGTSPNRVLAINNRDTADRAVLDATNDPSSARITNDGDVVYESSLGTLVVPVAGGDPAPLASSMSALTMWGDSLTQAGGIRTRLLELMPGSTIANEGIGGQRSHEIAARQGGGNNKVAIANDTIPASGPVAVTPEVTFLFRWGANQSEPALSRPGTLAGVHGVMSKPAIPEGGAPSSDYTFTRDVAGDEVPCPPGTPFILDASVPARHQTVTLWTGRNNAFTDVVGDTAAMVAHLTPKVPRFLVLSTTTATTETTGTSNHTRILQVNQWLEDDYGDRFVDVRRHLIDNGLAEAGITPTQDDLDAIAGDTIPPSLMLPGDTVHFNQVANYVIADYLYDRMVQKGWV